MKSAALAPGIDNWPYHLVVTQPNSDVSVGSAPLRTGQKYDIRLEASPDVLATHPPAPKYVYLFGFDCSGNAVVLYPDSGRNGDAMLPQPGQDATFPQYVTLYQEQGGISAPLGADTVFFMATQEKITDPSLITNDGVLQPQASRGTGGGLDDLMWSINNAGTRGFNSIPTHWTVQQLVIPSKP
jgi:hypothetical protein